MVHVKEASRIGGEREYELAGDGICGKSKVKNNIIQSVEIFVDDPAGFYKDFLTRSVIFILADEFDTVKTSYKDEYFAAFGFKEKAGGMQIKSRDITYVSRCRCAK